MITSLEQVRKFLGKQLQDPYGRTHGKLIGITANLRDETTAVGVETANGEFAQYPGERLWINGETLTLVPAWKLDAEEFRKEFDIVTRRLKALDELFSVGDIQQDIYEDLRKQHEDGINELKEKRRTLFRGESGEGLLDDHEGLPIARDLGEIGAGSRWFRP